jgi:hypothetical protein
MEAPVTLKTECLMWHGAGVGLEILRQIERRQRRAAQIAMLHAAQELFLATRWKNVAPPELICTKHYVEWRFEPVSYIYIPKVDDQLFRIYARARKRAKSIVLLIAPRYRSLVSEAFKRERRKDYFGLFTVDDYLAWRTMFAGLDAGWPKKKVILWWLSRYNHFVRRRGLPKSLIVHLEPRPTAPESWRR